MEQELIKFVPNPRLESMYKINSKDWYPVFRSWEWGQNKYFSIKIHGIECMFNRRCASDSKYTRK